MNYLCDFLDKHEPLGSKPLSNEQRSIFLNSLLRLMNVKSRVLEQCRSSHSEIMLLYFSLDKLTECGEYITAAQAAKDMGVSAPSVSRTLKNLEEKRLIERSLDKNDRRSVRIKVTDAGRRHLDKALDFVFATLDKVFNAFSNEERAEMVRLHCKLVDYIEKATIEANERRT